MATAINFFGQNKHLHIAAFALNKVQNSVFSVRAGMIVQLFGDP